MSEEQQCWAIDCREKGEHKVIASDRYGAEEELWLCGKHWMKHKTGMKVGVVEP